MLQEAVAGVVARQVDAGVDVVSDGEQSKAGYSTYVTERLTGFGGRGTPLRAQQDAIDFPELGRAAHGRHRGDPRHARLHRRRRLRAARARRARRREPAPRRSTPIRAPTGFMTTASPGVISLFLENQHYPSHEDYLARAGRGDAHRVRGAARLRDCCCRSTAPTSPSGATSSSRTCRWRSGGARSSCTSRRSTTRPATSRPRRCASTSAGATTRGPHNHDVPLAEILADRARARARRRSPSSSPTHGTSTSGASSRTSTCPTTRSSSPASSTRRRTTSSTRSSSPSASSGSRGSSGASASSRARDCGFATFAGFAPVFPSIVYAKLGALAEGAERASEELWG